MLWGRQFYIRLFIPVKIIPAPPTGVQYHYSATRWLAGDTEVWWQQGSVLISATGKVDTQRWKGTYPIHNFHPSHYTFSEWAHWAITGVAKESGYWLTSTKLVTSSILYHLIEKILRYEGPWWAFIRPKYCHTLDSRQGNRSGFNGHRW